MNPLINAYNYKINQLAQQISFIQKQNIILEAIIDQADGGGGFNYPEGQLIAQMPETPEDNPFDVIKKKSKWTFPGHEYYRNNSRRAEYLQQLWELLIRGNVVEHTLIDMFKRLVEQFNNMSLSDLENVIDFIRRNYITPNQLPDGTLRMQPLQILRNILGDPAFLRIIAPNLIRRIGRNALRWINSSPIRYIYITTILILIGWNVYAYSDGTRVFNSEEEFLQWLEDWMNENADNANPDFPELPTGPNGQTPPNWEDIIPPGLDPVQPSTEPELPSMLPPSNPSTTAPPPPGGGGGGGGGGVGGGGGGGLGARPIDPTQMGM